MLVGSRFVRARAGTKLAESSQSASLKIEAVLPPDLRERATRTRIFASVWRDWNRDEFAALIDRLVICGSGRAKSGCAPSGQSSRIRLIAAATAVAMRCHDSNDRRD